MSEKRITEIFFFLLGILLWAPLWWYLKNPWNALPDDSLFWRKPLWMPAFPIAALVLFLTSRMGTWTYHPKMGRIWPLVFAGMVGTAPAVSQSHLETWTGILGILLLYYSLIALQWRKVNYQGTYLKSYRPWIFLAIGGSGWGLAITGLGMVGLLFFPLLLLMKWWRTQTGPGFSSVIGITLWALLPIGALWIWWIMGLNSMIPHELWNAHWIWNGLTEWSIWTWCLPLLLAPYFFISLRGLWPIQNAGLSGAQTDLTHWMSSLEWTVVLLTLLLPGYLLPLWILFSWSMSHRVARVLHHLERGELSYHRGYQTTGQVFTVVLILAAVYTGVMALELSWAWWPEIPNISLPAMVWRWIAAVATSAVAGYMLRARFWKQRLWEPGVWVSTLVGFFTGALLVILRDLIN